MKIAFTAHWDWVLYHFRLTLAERLRSRGADVQFICPQGDYVHGLQEAGFRWLGWNVERRITNPLRETAAVVRLARLYRRGGGGGGAPLPAISRAIGMVGG